MDAFDRILEIFITIVLIIGGYQFYFWAQRQRIYKPRYLITRFDNMIHFDPRWIWIYSGLYYPMMLLAALAQSTWEAYAMTVGGFLFLLAIQMYFFLCHPVAIPAEWRKKARKNRVSRKYHRSMRFVELVWSFDSARNSMPSMHVSVATMVDLTISQTYPNFIFVGWLFPVLIGTSALKIKQHYIVDLLPGALLGASAFYLWHWLI